MHALGARRVPVRVQAAQRRVHEADGRRDLPSVQVREQLQDALPATWLRKVEKIDVS